MADVQGDKATIYSPTQGVWHQRSRPAMMLGLKPENVRVIFRRGSGCYGLNGADAVTLRRRGAFAGRRQAGARATHPQRRNGVGELRLRVRAWTSAPALDAKGNIVAWEHESWSPALGNRPGHRSRETWSPGCSRDSRPQEFKPGARAGAAPLQQQSATAFLRTWRATSAARISGTGTIKSEKRFVHNVVVAFLDRPAAFARAPAKYFRARKLHGRTGGASVKADPVEYRLRHLERCARDRRAEGSREGRELGNAPLAETGQSRDTGSRPAAASPAWPTKATTDTRPWSSRSKSNQDTGQGRGEAHRGSAIDAGPISNPDGLRNQAEGGALQGMSRALGEEVTWDDQKVTSIDWRTLPLAALGLRNSEDRMRADQSARRGSDGRG